MDTGHKRKQKNLNGMQEASFIEKQDWQGAEYFLTPQQRLNEIAEILADIALRSIQQEGIPLESEHRMDLIKSENENYSDSDISGVI